MNRRRTRGTDYQLFEERRLLASDISMSLEDGVLSIQGSDQADIIYVREYQDDVLVRYGIRGNGNLQGALFDAQEVNSLYFRGDTGNDVFVNSTSLDSRAFGN